MWNASEIPCDGANALSRLQIACTFTGLLVTFRGGNFGGEIASRRFRHKVRYAGCQSTLIRETAVPRAIFGVLRKHSFRLEMKPPESAASLSPKSRAFSRRGNLSFVDSVRGPLVSLAISILAPASGNSRSEDSL